MSTEYEAKVVVGYWLSGVWDSCKNNDLLNANEYVDMWDFREAELLPLGMVAMENEGFVGYEVPPSFNMDTKGRWYNQVEEFAFTFQAETMCEPMVTSGVYSY